MTERPTLLTLYDDGRVTVSHFPERTKISAVVLEHGDPQNIQIDGNRLTIVADNGRAIYELSRTADPMVYDAVAIERQWSEVCDATHH